MSDDDILKLIEKLKKLDPDFYRHLVGMLKIRIRELFKKTENT